MIYRTYDGKIVEIYRSSYTDDKSYYISIMKAKGLI